MRHNMKQEEPWYTRTHRWGQTNLTEMDAASYDMSWWKNYWRQTGVQGLIVNAGGIVAYYPSSFELQYRAQGLGTHDLFGAFVSEARNEGLAVVARMDTNRAAPDFYKAHPDWFAVNERGEPYASNGRYFSCLNSPYYKEYIPQVLSEIIDRYHPDGFADNSWTGVSRHMICYCEHCRSKFMRDCGYQLPMSMDWNDPIYRAWVKWSYTCRTENWDLFNQVTQQAGGADCLWIGMVHGSTINTHSFCSLKEIAERASLMMCDHQSRDASTGFEQNGLSGSLLHELAGQQTIVTESMANYVRGTHMFRKASNPPKETELWMIEGISGGISPWYHHIGATHEDKRQFHNAPPTMTWHEKNEQYLYNRSPIANVGLVWSEDNSDFYGRDNPKELVSLPWNGFVKSMTRARIPFLPVHADHIDSYKGKLDVLILPDLAVMTDKQCEALKRFVEGGGSLVFTGASATLDEWGDRREQFPLAELTGITPLHKVDGAVVSRNFDLEIYEAHNYLRIMDESHPILNDFTDTAILPFGGKIHHVEAGPSLLGIATYIPSFPIYPPEFSWMRETHTTIPAILAGEHPAGGRIVYFAGDIDRCYGRTLIPDLGDLLSNAIKWAAADTIPLQVEGPGYLDCRAYRQQDRLIIHLVNLSGANQYPGYLEEYLPVGPITVSVKLSGRQPSDVHLKVQGTSMLAVIEDGWAVVQLDQLIHHELIVIE